MVYLAGCCGNYQYNNNTHMQVCGPVKGKTLIRGLALPRLNSRALHVISIVKLTITPPPPTHLENCVVVITAVGLRHADRHSEMSVDKVKV